MINPSIQIGRRSISAVDPCYIIAEIGVNHNGNLALAHRLIDAAVDAGADAVKFQTYRTDELVLPDAAQAAYQSRNLGVESSQTAMLRRYELPFSDFHELERHCQARGIDFISTAFDASSLEFVISLAPVCLKWASGELTNKPMLLQAAASGLPLLLSTGMGSLAEVARSVDWLENKVPLAILQCVSDYPAAIEDQNLRVLPMLQAAFGCPVGFSDHTIGPYAAIAARALGMAILEKHFTLDRTMEGPDHRASITPDDFASMVTLLREVEAGLGDGIKRPRASEKDVTSVARKSLVYRHDLAKGHVVQAGDLTAKRPGFGLPPDQMDRIVGRALIADVKGNTIVRESDV